MEKNVDRIKEPKFYDRLVNTTYDLRKTFGDKKIKKTISNKLKKLGENTTRITNAQD